LAANLTAAETAAAEAAAAAAPALRYGRGDGDGAGCPVRAVVACAAASHQSRGEMCRWETRLVRLGDAGRPSKSIQYPLP